MFDSYDMILAAIPASGISIGGILHAIGIEPTFAVPLAASVALMVVIYGLFVDPPRDPALGPHQ